MERVEPENKIWKGSFTYIILTFPPRSMECGAKDSNEKQEMSSSTEGSSRDGSRELRRPKSKNGLTVMILTTDEAVTLVGKKIVLDSYFKTEITKALFYKWKSGIVIAKRPALGKEEYKTLPGSATSIVSLTLTLTFHYTNFPV